MQTTYKIGKFYNSKTLKEAIKSFEEVAKIEYKPRAWELIISWDTKEDREEIFNELMNYVVYLEC